jgi:hypothetical protein
MTFQPGLDFWIIFVYFLMGNVLAGFIQVAAFQGTRFSRSFLKSTNQEGAKDG